MIVQSFKNFNLTNYGLFDNQQKITFVTILEKRVTLVHLMELDV